MKYLSILILQLSLFAGYAIAQTTYEPSEFRSRFQERKKSTMDGNQLKATYHNYGQGGTVDKSLPDEVAYEFPRNTGRQYMLFQMIFVGAEVPNQANGGNPFPIVDVANLRESRSGSSWALNPISGYSNSSTTELARSDRGPGHPLGNTWPPYWPDKILDGGDGWANAWNGFFGKDQFNADIEFFYRSGDDLYTRYLTQSSTNLLWRPDSTDATRGGLGFLIDARIMAWTQTLINSTHFNIYELTNDASFGYDKVAFGLWIADFVGNNASNDAPQFDEIQATAYITDKDRVLSEPIFDGPIGEMGMKFLETPGNAIDGIDNDGDSYRYDPTNANPVGLALYSTDNSDLYSNLLSTNGGFHNQNALRDSVIPYFKLADFQSTTLTAGDKIVLIGPNDERIVAEYPVGGGTVISQGRTIVLPANGLSVNEALDVVNKTHADLIDNDFDGLIDENEPNHLEKVITRSALDTIGVEMPVRYINYKYFAVGDTIQNGLIVPNRLIRERMSNDPIFADLVNDKYDGRFINIYTAAPMIDEARDDYFDNDQDWNPLIDDVGLSGNDESPSAGLGDGKPTSGAGTVQPGEPSIDKTDVSESDLIGISRVNIFAAGQLDTDQDLVNWSNYLIPGDFVTDINTDSDIFVSSSLFPLRRGRTERFALAITAVQTKSQTRSNDRRATNDNLEQATKAYESDYQFATAPLPPVVKAVTGDGFVTLYWEPNSEESFDRYLQKITGNGYDFEGYKIYRATDNAFEDALKITNAYGTPQFLQPLITFDKVDGIEGLHPVSVRGVQYDMGSESGLQYSFTDRNVVNGKQYYYAVVAFDFGAESAGIAPSESPVQISQNPNGTISLGLNVVSVRPSDEQAGFVDPDAPTVTLVSGSPGGTVEVTVTDPYALKENAVYNVVFEDTLIASTIVGRPDTIRTKNFSLLDVSGTSVDTLIGKSTDFNGEYLPITDGFTLKLFNKENLEINTELTKWKSIDETKAIHPTDVVIQSKPKVNDYNIIIGDAVGFGQSSAGTVGVTNLPSIPTNFKVYSPYEGVEIPYIFLDRNKNNNPRDTAAQPDTTDPGVFSSYVGVLGSAPDAIYLLETVNGVQNVQTYRIQMNAVRTEGVVTTRNPKSGDTLKVRTIKPFTDNDIFEIRINSANVPKVDNELAKSELDNIKVVPNPYVVSSPYEPRRTVNNPVQQRELHFTHIPLPSTLRIFTVAGVMIREIKLAAGDPRVFNGTYRWDMLTKDNLEISYGVYIYHIDAPGVGSTTGKFAVIK
ncbi:hypothetical protein EP331_09225 [bacterium]|nr:MAG: hypothetical protein EP331_09225 [bacterium]